MPNNTKSNKHAYELIDDLKISKSWKEKFKLIYIAYGKSFCLNPTMMPVFWGFCENVASLTFFKKINFVMRANLFALFFGPLYYFAKGIIFSGLILLVFALIALKLKLIWLVMLIFLYCGYSADTDYFSAKILRSEKVITKPELLVDYFDNNLFEKYSKKLPVIQILKMSVMVVFSILTLAIAIQPLIEKNQIKYFKGVEEVCNGEIQCNAKIGSVKEIIRKHNLKGMRLSNNLYIIACAYYHYGQKKAALTFLNRAKIANPSNQKVYATSAYILTEMKNYSAALDNYRKILQINPNATYTYYYIGKVYYKKLEYRTAFDCFEKVTKRYPDEPYYLEALAYTKIYLNKREEAKEDILKAIKLFEKKGKVKNQNKINTLKRYYSAL